MISHMWNIKYDTNELFKKQKQTQGYQREKGWGRDKLGVWDQQIQTTIDKQQGSTVQHRELYSISCNKPEWKRICIYMYN